MAEEEHSSKRRKISDSNSPSLGSSELIPGLCNDVAENCLALVSRLDYPSLSCVNKTYNQLINGGELLGLRKRLKIVEHIVFLVRHCRCHPKGWVIFSPMKNKWLALPEIPSDESPNSLNQDSLAVNDELFVFCKRFTIWKLSLRSWCWVKCKDMHFPRTFFASGSLGGIAIVAGGMDMHGNELASAELYDSSTGIWEMLPNMHTPRNEGSGFFMDGKFYVIGGISNLDVPLTCGEEFDMETKTWRKIEGMYPNVNPTMMEAKPFFAVVDDELYTNEDLSNEVKKYNKANNKWEVMGRLPLIVDDSNVIGVEFKGCGDQLLVFCDEAVSGNDNNIVVNSWCLKSGVKDGNLDWKVIGTKVNFGVCKHIFTDTVMGC